jgi:hypothetical protein
MLNESSADELRDALTPLILRHSHAREYIRALPPEMRGPHYGAPVGSASGGHATAARPAMVVT